MTEIRPGHGQNLRLALLLGVAGAIAAALMLPYLLATMPQVFAKLPLPLSAVAALQSVQAFVLVTVLAFAGLSLQHRTGLDAPWLRALLTRRPRPAQAWGRAAVIGALAGIAIVALAPLTDGFLPAPLHPLPGSTPATASLAGFLASFYGGIVEETELRLFLMTLVAWIAVRLGGTRAPWMFWLAIVLAALLFGAGHLPAAARIWPLDAVVVLRTLLLNGVAGLAFGWLYWKQGFESAVLAHFCADLVLHVGGPLLAAGIA